MEKKPSFIIRPATHHDVRGINAILTHYALNTVMTFATTAQADSIVAAKLESIISEQRLPFLVASAQSTGLSVDQGDLESSASQEVLGICYVSPYRAERQAYRHTGEVSLFVHPEYHFKGIGSALLRAILDAARETRIREPLAVMAVDDTGREKGLALREFYKDVTASERIDVITLQLHAHPSSNLGPEPRLTSDSANATSTEPWPPETKLYCEALNP